VKHAQEAKVFWFFSSEKNALEHTFFVFALRKNSLARLREREGARRVAAGRVRALGRARVVIRATAYDRSSFQFEQKRLFFSEEKNQKTFMSCARSKIRDLAGKLR